MSCSVEGLGHLGFVSFLSDSSNTHSLYLWYSIKHTRTVYPYPPSPLYRGFIVRSRNQEFEIVRGLNGPPNDFVCIDGGSKTKSTRPHFGFLHVKVVTEIVTISTSRFLVRNSW